MEDFLNGVNFGALWVVVLLVLFQVKHLVVDFFIQNRFPYMWLNKGKFFHPGGWLHSLGHAIASYAVFSVARPPVVGWETIAITLCVMELFVHFGIDLVKVRVSQWREWKCNTSPYFWDALGVDQFLHQMTYLYMVAVFISSHI